MNFKKKALSLLLVLAMLLPAFPPLGFAEEDDNAVNGLDIQEDILQTETANLEEPAENSDPDNETEQVRYAESDIAYEPSQEPEQSPDVDTSPVPAEETEQQAPESTEYEPGFTVVYHSNYNNGIEESSFAQYFNPEDTVVTAFNSFSLEGGIFLGWNTSPAPYEQMGAGYAENVSVDISLYPQGLLELYAQWETNGSEISLFYNALYCNDLDIDGVKSEILANIPSEQVDAVPFADTDVQVCSDSEAAFLLRDAMVRRASNCVFSVKVGSRESSTTLGNAIVYEAIRHTGNPGEGDYIAWQGLGLQVSKNTLSGIATFSFAITYLTTAAQEAQVDAAVESIISSLGLRSMENDYEKVIAVHDWICDTADITYSAATDITHSAYAAIISRSACCQGFSQLFYRIMCELGIDCRVIRGEAYMGGSGGGHAWNIVKVGDYYYNIDTTWDNNFSYIWFLRGTDMYTKSHFCETCYADALANNVNYVSIIVESSADVRYYNMSPADYLFSDTKVSVSPDTVVVDRANSSAFSVNAEIVQGTESSQLKIALSYYGSLSYLSGTMSGNMATLNFNANADGTFYIFPMCVNSAGKPVGMPAMVTVKVGNSIQPGQYTVSFDTTGGTEIAAVTCGSNNKVQIPNTVPEKENCSFRYWTDSSGNRYAPGEYLTLSSNITLTASWRNDSVTVQFDGNGGSYPSSILLHTGKPYGTLPVSTRAGYLFQGWYTARTGGTRVEPDTIVLRTSSHMIYAHWGVSIPEITAQPTDVVARTFISNNFSIKVAGECYTLRWQQSTDNKSTWTDISGATSDTYNFTPKKTMDGYYFRCVVGYGDKELISNEVLLTVKISPLITAHPTDITVIDGSTATFTINSTGEDYTFQWQKSIDGGETWSKISDATSDSFSFTATSNLNGTCFRCLLCYDGSKRIPSKTAVLTVLPDILRETNFNDRALLLALYQLYPTGIAATEAAEITKLNLSGKGISDLTGLEIFSGLTELDVSDNCLKSADLSIFTKLNSFNGAGQQPGLPVMGFISADGNNAVCDISNYYCDNAAELQNLSTETGDKVFPETGAVSCILTSNAGAGTLKWNYNVGNGFRISVSAPIALYSLRFGRLPEYVSIAGDEDFNLPMTYSNPEEFDALQAFFNSFNNFEVIIDGDSNCIAVSFHELQKLSESSCSFATVSGSSEGTCWATVCIKVGDLEFTRFSLRVDVCSDEGPKNDVIGVSLDTKKTTVMLYSTDYPVVNVLLESNRLADSAPLAAKGSVVIDQYETGAGTGHSIESAEFTDFATAELFDIRVVDDRRLEILPRYDTVNGSWLGILKLKGSYKSTISVKLSGRDIPLETGLLTLSVNKSVPKLKVNAVCFNTALGSYGMTEKLAFTGGNVTAVDQLTFVKPVAWVKVNSGNMSVSYIGAQGFKGSGSANLFCRAEGWAVSLPVTLKLSAVNKAATVKLKATGSIEKSLEGSYVLITPTVSNGSAVGYSLETVINDKTKLDYGSLGMMDNFSFNASSMKLSISSGASLQAGSYTAVFSAKMRDGSSVESIKLKFKITETPVLKLKPKFTLSSKEGTLFLNDKNDRTQVTLGLTQAPLPENYVVRLDSKSQAFFEIKSFNPDTGEVVIGWRAGPRTLKLNSAKTLKLEIFLEGNDSNAPKAKPNATLSYKITICGN